MTVHKRSTVMHCTLVVSDAKLASCSTQYDPVFRIWCDSKSSRKIKGLISKSCVKLGSRYDNFCVSMNEFSIRSVNIKILVGKSEKNIPTICCPRSGGIRFGFSWCIDITCMFSDRVTMDGIGCSCSLQNNPILHTRCKLQ